MKKEHITQTIKLNPNNQVKLKLTMLKPSFFTLVMHAFSYERRDSKDWTKSRYNVKPLIEFVKTNPSKTLLLSQST